MVPVFVVYGVLSVILACVRFEEFDVPLMAANIISLVLLLVLILASAGFNELYMKRERYKVVIPVASVFALVFLGVSMFDNFFGEAEAAFLVTIQGLAWSAIMLALLVSAFNSFIRYLWKITKEASASLVFAFMLTIPWILALVYMVGFFISNFVEIELFRDSLSGYFLTLGISYLVGGWFLSIISKKKDA